MEENVQKEEVKGSGTTKFLTFRLENETFGINISDVDEIIGLLRITELPDSPAYVRGIINLRGKVIPVIDLRLRFKLPEREYNERNSIIVVTVEDGTVGLVCDTVAEVIDIEDGMIDPAPNIVRTSGKDYVEGIGRVGEEVVILLSTRRVLDGAYDPDTIPPEQDEAA